MIYILGFEKPFHHAKYYVGFCEEGRLRARLAEHRACGAKAARILVAAAERGIGWHLVATLPGDRTEERRIKNCKNTPKLVERIRKQQGMQNGLPPDFG